MDTIWVENIKLLENLETIKTYVTEVNIKSSLLEKQFGTVSHEAEEVLKDKATACGIFKSGFLGDANNTSTRPNQDVDSEYQAKTLSHYKEGSICSSVSSEDLREELSKQYLGNSIHKKISTNCGNKICSEQSDIFKDTSKELLNQQKRSSDEEEEVWENLPENRFCRVLVGAFYTPNNFYVQHLTDIESKEKLYDAIDKFAEENPIAITHPKIGLNCLAKYEDKYNRAKITKVLCDGKNDELSVSLFFCDIGISETIKLSEVLHSSEELVNMLPFQAIRCKMTGIVPTTYGLWTTDTCDDIYDNVLDPAQYLYARPVRIEMPDEKSDLKYWRCEVVLLDCSGEVDMKINDKIVKMGLANYDPETEHFLSIVPNLSPRDSDDDNDSIGSNWDECNYQSRKIINFNPESGLEDLDLDVDIQFSQEDILQLLNLPTTAKILPPEPPKIATITEIDESPIEEKSPADNLEQKKISMYYKNKALDENRNLTSSGSSESDRIQYKSMPRLKSLYKSPLVLWQQSESLISLQINTPDIEDYYLRVTSTNLLFIANIQNDTRVLSLNFCGCIDCSLVSHEIRGLKVIVRLPKAIKGLIWPRLTYDSDKPSWLKYNYDSIVIEQEAFLNTARYRQETALMDDSSDTDSYMDEDDYPTRPKDMFDPFDDEFTA